MHTNDTSSAVAGKRQFLSFQLGGLVYGVDFHKVKELRTLGSLDRFEADGSFVSGVAMSRGVIMPIVDMRAAFSARIAGTAHKTDVIILQLASCVMGMVVDGVTDVVQLDPEQVAPMPQGGGGLHGDCDYLMGLADAGGRRLILVDIDKLMSIRRAGDEQQAA